MKSLLAFCALPVPKHIPQKSWKSCSSLVECLANMYKPGVQVPRGEASKKSYPSEENPRLARWLSMERHLPTSLRTHPSLISETHTVEGGNQLLQIVLWPPHGCTAHAHPAIACTKVIIKCLRKGRRPITIKPQFPAFLPSPWKPHGGFLLWLMVYLF